MNRCCLQCILTRTEKVPLKQVNNTNTSNSSSLKLKQKLHTCTYSFSKDTMSSPSSTFFTKPCNKRITIENKKHNYNWSDLDNTTCHTILPSCGVVIKLGFMRIWFLSNFLFKVGRSFCNFPFSASLCLLELIAWELCSLTHFFPKYNSNRSYPFNLEYKSSRSYPFYPEYDSSRSLHLARLPGTLDVLESHWLVNTEWRQYIGITRKLIFSNQSVPFFGYLQ